jgi:hypothetical protein
LDTIREELVLVGPGTHNIQTRLTINRFFYAHDIPWSDIRAWRFRNDYPDEEEEYGGYCDDEECSHLRGEGGVNRVAIEISFRKKSAK